MNKTGVNRSGDLRSLAGRYREVQFFLRKMRKKNEYYLKVQDCHIVMTDQQQACTLAHQQFALSVTGIHTLRYPVRPSNSQE